MNRSLASSRAARLAAESMPAPGDNDEVLDTVGGLEGLHNGDDRGGLSLVALPAADLERETGPVDQQAHDDLRVDPPLLGVTNRRRSSSRSASKYKVVTPAGTGPDPHRR